MDNCGPWSAGGCSGAPERRALTVAAQWSARPVAVAAAGSAGAVATLLAVLAADSSGRLLLGLAATGLLGAATLGALLRPRLAADAQGLAVRGPTGTVRLQWGEIEVVEVVRTRRLGRTVPVLEISPYDTPDRVGALLVLTRVELGADPRDVLDRLLAVRLGQG